MTRLVQILVVCLAVAGLVGSTAADARTSAAPTGLKPFLLRVDEPASRSFSRTPAFAWKPVKGAQRLRVPALDERFVPRERGHLLRHEPDDAPSPRRR